MSIAKFDSWQNIDGTENYKCRAWVNFNGTGTVAIRSSGNVSSVTDNGTGDYTVNFTSALADANYAANVTAGGTAGVDETRTNEDVTARTSSAFRLLTINTTFAATDCAVVSAVVIR